MKYFYLSLIVFFYQCAFANLEQKLKPFSENTTKGKISESITILNQNRVFSQKKYTGWYEMNPIFGLSRSEYFAKKQQEIGVSRYHWKTIYTHNIEDKDFELTNVKTDYVIFVVANQPKSNWEQASFGQVLQILTICLFPCKDNLSLEVTVKLYHQNRLVSEKKTLQLATRFISPWYALVPHQFQMRDYGLAFNEPNVVSTLYLQGFQEAIDDIYLHLPNQVEQEAKIHP
ncbi:hypothetical protein EHQ16_02535 [Leptospira kanakyensis]|uniref:Uncharacterized protein n=1 Tax=Leptospira kanakyensis TaxID=2484968 RepID=A0A6N4Q019_9LEPT|nr:hypothetical protein [Leptospira kanakyensis]TGK47643.1 hypothetical protein EHQ11_17095 [Leptospira kanakyensis]TGK63354.1 hypothetical protein EHQ16_02535 [Leptospira kanakyensis]TGK66959.1 hypothetical protein EHQ18_17770 [Leptospira kanakyensis]